MRDAKRRTDSLPPQGCERGRQAAAPVGSIAVPQSDDGSQGFAAFCVGMHMIGRSELTPGGDGACLAKTLA